MNNQVPAPAQPQIGGALNAHIPAQVPNVPNGPIPQAATTATVRPIDHESEA
ncbi:hypothetical protein FRC17_006539, partial [Serendipita sp. 399]